MTDVDLNSQAVKDAIAQAVKEATEGLTAKNAELLAEKRKLQKQAEIKPEDLERVESERDTAQAELAKYQKQVKDLSKANEDMAKRFESESKYTQQLLVDNGLTDALTKAGVTDPVHLKYVKTALASQVQVVADGDNRVAKIGDKPLSDYIGEWAKGDEGKLFVKAPANSGGGAQGGGGQGNTKTLTRAEFDAKSPNEKMEFAKTGGTVIN